MSVLSKVQVSKDEGGLVLLLRSLWSEGEMVPKPSHPTMKKKSKPGTEQLGVWGAEHSGRGSGEVKLLNSQEGEGEKQGTLQGVHAQGHTGPMSVPCSAGAASHKWLWNI